MLDRLLGWGRGTVLEQQEETRRIVQLLQEGLTPEEAEHDLVRSGVPAGRARRRVQVVLKARRHMVHLFDPPASPGASE